MLQGWPTRGNSGDFVPLSLSCHYACHDLSKFVEGRITAQFTASCLKQNSGCSGHSFPRTGAGRGPWGYKDISVQG